MRITIELELPEENEKLHRILNMDNAYSMLFDIYNRAGRTLQEQTGLSPEKALSEAKNALSAIERMAREGGLVVR